MFGYSEIERKLDKIAEKVYEISNKHSDIDHQLICLRGMIDIQLRNLISHIEKEKKEE